jgi:hypothetical protein
MKHGMHKVQLPPAVNTATILLVHHAE